MPVWSKAITNKTRNKRLNFMLLYMLSRIVYLIVCVCVCAALIEFLKVYETRCVFKADEMK